MNKHINKHLEKVTKDLIDSKMIARWKIINPLEYVLSRLADNSLFWKKIYVLFYKVFDYKYYRNGLKTVKKIIYKFKGELSKAEERFYIIDMIYSLHRFGTMFTEYFLFDFPKLNTVGRSSFITDKLRYSYCHLLNDKNNLTYFNNKEKTYELFKDYFGREVYLVDGEQCFSIFEDFVKKHKKFIKKPSVGSCGRGVEVLSILDYDNPKQLFNYILSCGPSMIEELVYNVKEIQAISPNALSTVRIPTIRVNNQVHLFYPILRLPKGSMVVDNVGSGGLVALLDVETGCVISPACDKNNGRYFYHPDTNEQIIGFSVPFWSEAVHLAKRLSDVIPTNRYVGWDLALTDKGWIMIEGNARGELYMMQFPDGRGKKHELDRLLVENCKLFGSGF